MAWGPEKRAGFALAALLSDDRELHRAGPALEPALRTELADQLARAGARKADAIPEWLALLRPELTERTLALPPRLRALLAPLARPPLRQALLAGRPPARANFTADRDLLAALLRIARWSARADQRENEQSGEHAGAGLDERAGAAGDERSNGGDEP